MSRSSIGREKSTHRTTKAFVEAVKKTRRKKLIVAGVSTEVCVAFVALSAVKEGCSAASAPETT